MLKIAVLISGGGSNLQSIIDNINSGYLKNCTIEYVISDRENAYGIKRARENDIKTMVFDRKKYSESLSDEILKVLKNKVNLIVLAGFTSILNKDFIENFKNKIINIHPSLIPNFCGKGMYGIKVHEAAINYGVKVSGCTVHFVDEGTDTGAIILQNTVNVYGEDSAESLQKKILIEEHKALPEAIKLISEDKVKIEGRVVYIKE
ncbi:phosphoribosylglycinamide formyltransferase [Clostridium sp. UBA6640]|uniref:phosphoribosylglycinamide formyltransferase n=1 Tax=Clostridium sp. UBA6640 TaxID=1946370 RepID=UPI0025C3534F|nr:phosphoribosylglycinamide formyltransferase [Clostridium sp. UBA6640]